MGFKSPSLQEEYRMGFKSPSPQEVYRTGFKSPSPQEEYRMGLKVPPFGRDLGWVYLLNKSLIPSMSKVMVNRNV